VIWALESDTVDDAAQRQPRPTMNAQVPPGDELAAGAPDDKVLAQHPDRDRATID
jgi:hypothetical protein